MCELEIKYPCLNESRKLRRLPISSDYCKVRMNVVFSVANIEFPFFAIRITDEDNSISRLHVRSSKLV